MGVLDNVRALKDQTRSSLSPRPGESKGFFSTLPGVLAALAAFITAMVSLVQSCNSANKAVLERMDKVADTCQEVTATERAERDKQVRELIEKNQALRDENQKTRELAFEYYRKLEQRVYDLEPGPHGVRSRQTKK